MQTNTTIVIIQETKLIATKSTNYIQNLFPQYKLIFNNTHVLTRCIHQCMPYTSGRVGLLTLIHNRYTFPGNITKIPIPINISPYLQLIRINNQPLQPWLIMHMYMPTHIEDLQLIPNIKTTITHPITVHPDHGPFPGHVSSSPLSSWAVFFSPLLVSFGLICFVAALAPSRPGVSPSGTVVSPPF